MSVNGKIYSLHDLAEKLAGERANGAKVIHCHGVFDLVHIGHIRYFQQAKNMGDVLVVTITPDRYVNKGPHRPVFNEYLRLEAVAALSVVDYVAVNEWPMAIEAIKLLKPDFYVKGSDYKDLQQDITGGILLEKEAVEQVGGQLAFTDDITFSSSNLLNQHISVFPKAVSNYLTAFAQKYKAERVLGYLEQTRDLKVLVIGETIIDEYVYCETMGKSGKEPILAARYSAEEKFVGGAIAIANHISAFTDNVTLLTLLGGQNSHEAFIRDRLSPAIEPVFVYNENEPTIIKRRFVENYPFQKLFELYVMNWPELIQPHTELLCAELERRLPLYDVVVVADYGHGMIGPEVVDLLCQKAPFLAVNTQVNAGNMGFNTISKYHRADYISLSENELRLDVRNRKRHIQAMIAETCDRLACNQMIVSKGKEGCISYSPSDGFFEVPTFTNRIVDQVGAGDTMFSGTALCATLHVPVEVMGFIGNVLGAQAVGIVGNRHTIDRVGLFKHIKSLLT